MLFRSSGADRFDRGWGSGDVCRLQLHTGDPTGTCECRLPMDDHPATGAPTEARGDCGGRDDAPADLQDPVDALDASLKISPLLGDRRCKEEVPDRMSARRAGFSRESVLEYHPSGRLRISECNETVAQISDRRNAEPLPKYA